MLHQSKLNDSMNSFQSRLEYALNSPFTNRCAELTILIDRSHAKDLQNYFPKLIENIFGPNGSTSWKLKNISSLKYPNEYTSVHHFLSPLGPLFRLIYKLLTETQIKFEFPVSYLPGKVRQNLEHGKIPPFYTDIISVDSQTRKLQTLSLNAFDFYMFNFAYYLINPYQQYTDREFSQGISVYYVLSCDYILHFLPTDPNVVILPQLINFTGKNPNIIPPQFINNRPQNISKLFRNHILQQSSSNITSLHQPMQQHPRNEIWRSEAVVQIFIDVWFNSVQSNKNEIFLYKQEQKINCLPSGEYIRMLRVFVKQLHAFSASSKYDTSSLGELKKIVQSMLQAPMYTFLRHLIHQWPTDGSFRLVLELWLSYIQPWRYIGDNQVKLQDQEFEEIIGQNKVVDEQYMGFIAENLLAYTVILQQLLPRFSRVDLSSPKTALMLFRISKVFGQQNLVPILREIENCIEDLNHSPSHSYSVSGPLLPPLTPTSCWSTNTNLNTANNDYSFRHDTVPAVNYNTPRPNSMTNKWVALVRHRIYEWEGPDFCYKPMFTKQVAPEVHQLLAQIRVAEQVAQDIIYHRTKQQREQYGNLITSFFKSLFEMEDVVYDEFSMEERKKVPSYLSASKSYLLQMFNLNDGIENAYIFETSGSQNLNSSSTFNNENKLDISPNVSRQRARYLKYQGDPDILPVRSNENEFLVRVLHDLCCKINSMYSLELKNAYNRNDFVGKLSRQILHGPLLIRTYDKSVPGYASRITKILPPRISLRQFASHTTLAFILLGFLFTHYFLDFGVFSYFLILILLWFSLIFFKAVIDRKELNVRAVYSDESMLDLSY